MDPVNALICMAAAAWVGQIALGWQQINRFNQAIGTLSKSGQICIGRSAGRFKPRIILALAVSDEGRITGNFVIKGLTVFARPYSDNTLTGKTLSELHPETLFPANKALREALTLAISNKRC